MPKVSEVEFPLISLGVTFTQELRQKGKSSGLGRTGGVVLLGSFPQLMGQAAEGEIQQIGGVWDEASTKKGEPSGTVSGQSSATIPPPLPPPRQKTGPTETGEAASPLWNTTPNLAWLQGRQPLESSR